MTPQCGRGRPGARSRGDIAATVAAGRTAVEERAPGARGRGRRGRTGGRGGSPGTSLGETAAAETAATAAVQHPTSPQRPFALVIALGTLAMTELDCGRSFNAQTYAERAVAVGDEFGIGEIAVSAIALTALGAVHAAQGRLAEAEREAARAEVLRRAPDRNIPHAHALLVLAGIRMQRGRLDRAAADLERAWQEIDGFPDAGRLPAMAEDLRRALDDACAHSIQGAPVEPPSEAELLVLRLLQTALSQREIGASLYLSVNTVKTHTRELYRKLGVRSRDDAVARAVALRLIDEVSR